MSRNSEIEQLTIDRTVTYNKSFFSSKTNTVWLALLLLILVFVSYFLIQVLFHSTKKSLSPVVNNVQVDNRINPETKGNLTAFVTSSTVLEANKNQGNSASTFPDNSVLDASGHIVARRIATVSSIITGKLTQLNIEEGQQVHRTQILAQLDDKQAQISYHLAQADLTANQAHFNELTIVHEHELKRLNRYQTLFDQSLVSEQLLDDTSFIAEKIAAQLSNKKALVELSRQKLALAQYQLEQHKIRAPFDGVVISKNAQIGELISSGSSGGGFIRTGVGTIVDMDSLEIEVEVAETYINRVHINQKTVATLDAYPNWKIPSEVIAVIPTANRQKASIKVRVKLQATDIKILPDMGVKVSFLESHQVVI